MLDTPQENDLVCPVCRAVQRPSETCRRCRCDLQLVLRVEQAAGDARRSALLHIAENRWSDALRAVRTLNTLRADADSQRLLAVCCLLAGEFLEATQFAARQGSSN